MLMLMMTITWMARMRMIQGSQRSNFVDVFPVHTFFRGQSSLWQVLNSLDILFLWLVVVFDGNVLDMKALFGHICSLMSIKRGCDREICQKLQNRPELAKREEKLSDTYTAIRIPPFKGKSA